MQFVRHIRQRFGSRATALAALAAAGVTWGLTVPLSKFALEWLGPAWLTVGRFAVAAPVLAFVARRRLRRAWAPAVAAWGAVGYGAVILVQNAGIERTSVSHAALLVGVVPALVALMSVALGRGSTGPRAWLGLALALSGVGVVAGGGGGSASASGDALVLLSVTVSAATVTAQPRLLAGRDPVAVTAVQLGAGALIALPAALTLEGPPPAPPAGGWALPAAVLLATAGTLLPFTLFAYGQARVAPPLAGAFLNLEPLVGALAGAVAFGDTFGLAQLGGGVVLVAGIALSALPRRTVRSVQPYDADTLEPLHHRPAESHALPPLARAARPGRALPATLALRPRPDQPRVRPHARGGHRPRRERPPSPRERAADPPPAARGRRRSPSPGCVNAHPGHASRRAGWRALVPNSARPPR